MDKNCSLFEKTVVVHGLCMFLGILIIIAPVSSAYAGDETRIKAMTRNLYLGADIFKVVDAAETDPSSVPFVVTEVYMTMLYTNFWVRAQAIADEIAAKKPDVIGLQEVETFYKQTPGDFLAGNQKQADRVVIDFYSVLNRALKARGMYYDAFSIDNADVELPMFDLCSPTLFSDVRMVDHDYILVRKGLKAREVLAGNYDVKLETDIGGNPVAFDRGFVIVDVTVRGQCFRVANTHLEVCSSPDSVFRIVQYYQMLELLGSIEYLQEHLGSRPVVMVGDFNSSSTDVPGMGLHPVYGEMPYTPPYMLAMGAGFLDTWFEQDAYDEGYTSGFDEYVSDPAAELTSRIDHIFLDPCDLVVGAVSSDVVGDEVRDMVPNPIAPWFLSLWPSDHAGVAAEITFLP